MRPSIVKLIFRFMHVSYLIVWLVVTFALFLKANIQRLVWLNETRDFFFIYRNSAHILLIIASGIVILSVFFGFLGIVRRRWRYLIVAMICLVLYMSILSGSCASGFAYYDRLRPTLESDVARTTAPIWSSIRSTYSCVGTNCVNVLETAMYNNKIRIGIISAVFLLVPSLILIVLMFQMRRDILYFKWFHFSAVSQFRIIFFMYLWLISDGACSFCWQYGARLNCLISVRYYS